MKTFRKENILEAIQWCLDNNRLPLYKRDKTIYSRLRIKDKFYPYIIKFKESFKKFLEGNTEAMKEIESTIQEIRNLPEDLNQVKKEDPLLIELKDFVDTHKRFPGVKDQEEKHLRKLILRNLSTSPQLHLSLSKYIQKMEIILGCKFKKRRKKYNNNEELLKNYLEWCEKHGYRPSWSGDKEEKTLYEQQDNLRCSNSQIAKELRKIHDKFPNKREFLWNSKFTKLQEFIKENNRLPRAYIESEKIIYSWVHNQIYAGNSKVLQLIENCGLSPRARKDMVTSLKEFEIYVLTTGLLPPMGHLLNNWYNHKHTTNLEIKEKAINFWKVFKLSREGNQKAIEIIEAIRKVVLVEDK